MKQAYMPRKDFHKIILKNFDCYKRCVNNETKYYFISYLSANDYYKIVEYLKNLCNGETEK